MGTGSTLVMLPPENATEDFVKGGATVARAD
jgi:hypothetical protein